MGRKYIVEVGRLERLYKASVNVNGKPNLTWLSPEVDLTPYTEPDLEQVRKEAYAEGFKDGQYAERNGLVANYAQVQETIQVGDEVRNIQHGWTAVVSAIDRECMTLMDTNGKLGDGYNMNRFIKTGRHFPEIATVLEKMRGEQDG